jgi:hypothetical protein
METRVRDREPPDAPDRDPSLPSQTRRQMQTRCRRGRCRTDRQSRACCSRTRTACGAPSPRRRPAAERGNPRRPIGRAATQRALASTRKKSASERRVKYHGYQYRISHTIADEMGERHQKSQTSRTCTRLLPKSATKTRPSATAMPVGRENCCISSPSSSVTPS